LNSSMQIISKRDTSIIKITEDAKQIENLNASAALLANNLSFTKSLVESVLGLRDFVPAQHTEVWTKTLFPQMKNALVNDTKMFNGIVAGMGKVRNLGIKINTAAKMFNQTNGNKDCLAIISTSLPKALEELKTAQKAVEGLNMDILQVFEQNAGEILKVVGSKDLQDLAEKKKKILKEIEELQSQSGQLRRERALLQGEVEQYASMELMISQRMQVSTDKLESIKNMVGDMQKRIKDSQASIDSIPKTITQKVDTHHSNGWWLWKRHSHTTEYREVANPDRDTQAKYYDNLINQRLSTITQIENSSENKEKAALQLLQDDLAKNKNLRTQKADLLKEFYQGGQKYQQLEKIEREIEKLYGQIDALEEQAKDVENQIGHKGKTAIDCLLQVNVFLENAHQSTKVLQPMVVMIDVIIARVEDNVELIKSGKRENVWAGGVELMVAAGLLATTCSLMEKVTQPFLSLQAGTNKMLSIKD